MVKIEWQIRSGCFIGGCGGWSMSHLYQKDIVVDFNKTKPNKKDNNQTN